MECAQFRISPSKIRWHRHFPPIDVFGLCCAVRICFKVPRCWLLPEYYKNIPCMPALFLLPQNILLSSFSYLLFYLFGSDFAKLISVPQVLRYFIYSNSLQIPRLDAAFDGHTGISDIRACLVISRFVRKERAYSAQLQDTFPSVYDRNFIFCHKRLSQWATVLQRTVSCRCRSRRLQGYFCFLRISAASGGCSWWDVPSA